MKALFGHLVRPPVLWITLALGLGLPILLARALYLMMSDATSAEVAADGFVLSVIGAMGLTLGFIGLLMLARLLLRYGGGTFSVARTVLDEALHMKIAIVFIVLLLVIVPTLPFIADSADPLRYRVQGFLSYSMTVTVILLSLLTIFLACWTLSGEIENKQIFSVATKPLSRWRYLLGKWVGIVVLNGILLFVASVGIYSYTMFLSQQQATEEHDRIALDEEVLTARIAQRAKPSQPLEDVVRQRLEQLQRNDPDTIRRTGEQQAHELGVANAGDNMVMELGLQAIQQQMFEQVERQWRSVAPMGATSFVFEGLEDAHRYSDFIQFRYHARVTEEVPDGQIGVIIEINGQPSALNVVIGQTQVMPLPVELIQDGRIDLTIHNRSPQNPNASRDITVVFDGSDGLEMLYRVDSFGPNFFRGVLANWIKLGFLAMLGLTAASFLGFPVASTFSLMIFIAAAASPFLLETVGTYGAGPGLTGAVQGGMSSFSTMISSTLQRFAQYGPGSDIVDGRYFGWASVGGCLLWIGVIWTGGIGLVAALIFRNRELARVQV
ncbi:MAG: ABC transporter permease [Phycisphaeraceae bacterium]